MLAITECVLEKKILNHYVNYDVFCFISIIMHYFFTWTTYRSENLSVSLLVLFVCTIYNVYNLVLLHNKMNSVSHVEKSVVHTSIS